MNDHGDIVKTISQVDASDRLRTFWLVRNSCHNNRPICALVVQLEPREAGLNAIDLAFGIWEI